MGGIHSSNQKLSKGVRLMRLGGGGRACECVEGLLASWLGWASKGVRLRSLGGGGRACECMEGLLAYWLGGLVVKGYTSLLVRRASTLGV